MKTVIILFFSLLYSLSYAQAPDGYYSKAEGLNGFQLKTALKIIIDDVDDSDGFPFHQDRGYGALFDAYASETSGDTDIYYENDGTVLDMYSEIVEGSEAYNYEHYIDKCGNYSNEGDCYNREHLVPQSTFNGASPMRNDYFHTFPTDGAVNGARSNFPFGEVINPNYTSTNGSKRGPNTFPGYLGIVFEPIDEFKGDIARSILYFAIRYEDDFNSSWSKNEVLANNPQDFFVDWYIKLLLSWHIKDPVSQREIDRNNNGFQFQGNRNPLIDHPEYATRIWGDIDSQAPTAPQNLQSNAITNTSVELSWEASEDDLEVSSYIVEQDHINIAQISSEHLNYKVSGLSSETLYNFRIYALDGSGNISEPSENLEVLTLAESNILSFEDFENCTTVQNNFISVSEYGDFNWECHNSFGMNDTKAYVMNAFQNNETKESTNWLITTDKINFDNYEIEKLSFWTSARYGNTKLELLYSTTYDGKGNPSNFQWQEVPNISIPLHPSANSSLFVFEANTIDISEISGETYIAFRYDTTNGENATQWAVDNFLLTGEQLLSNFQFSKTFEVILYPNPSKSSNIHLDFNRSGLKTIDIYNVSGKKVLTRHTHQKKYQENLSDFPRGIYFVKVERNESSVVNRLILK